MEFSKSYFENLRENQGPIFAITVKAIHDAFYETWNSLPNPYPEGIQKMSSQNFLPTEIPGSFEGFSCKSELIEVEARHMSESFSISNHGHNKHKAAGVAKAIHAQLQHNLQGAKVVCFLGDQTLPDIFLNEEPLYLQVDFTMKFRFEYGWRVFRRKGTSC